MLRLPLLIVSLFAAGVSFEDPLGPELDKGWRWVHEVPDGWRVDARGLHLRSLPGTVWGPPNSGKNQLVRDAPAGDLDVEVTLHMDPDQPERWEQAGLLWYVDDDRFVKLVKELEHGKWNIVMGREWEARTKVLCVTPIADGPVRLRLQVRGNKIIGHYRVGDGKWLKASECEFPKVDAPKIGLHAQRGPAKREHWVRLHDLSIKTVD